MVWAPVEDSAPWTEQIAVRWRPSLAFYEHRFLFLRELEEASLLSGFRVRTDDAVDARIRGVDYEASLRSTGLSVSAKVRSADWEPIAFAISLAIRLSEPEQLTAVTVDFSHLSHLEGEYDAMRVQSAEAWFGPWSASARIIQDHATLVDGETELAKYKMEFGIIKRSEAKERLERRSGRLETELSRLPHSWKDEDVPPVAIFVGSSWEALSVPEAEQETVAESIATFRNTSNESVVRVIDELQTSLLSVE